jgi:hypothetical protein
MTIKDVLYFTPSHFPLTVSQNSTPTTFPCLNQPIMPYYSINQATPTYLVRRHGPVKDKAPICGIVILLLDSSIEYLARRKLAMFLTFPLSMSDDKKRDSLR